MQLYRNPSNYSETSSNPLWMLSFLWKCCVLLQLKLLGNRIKWSWNKNICIRFGGDDNIRLTGNWVDTTFPLKTISNNLSCVFYYSGLCFGCCLGRNQGQGVSTRMKMRCLTPALAAAENKPHILLGSRVPAGLGLCRACTIPSLP